MTVSAAGRPAVSHYRIERRFRRNTLLRVRLETGRTHQIRVHLAHVGLPIVGDPVYGGRQRVLPAEQATEAHGIEARGTGAQGTGPHGIGAHPAGEVNAALRAFRRQALHAQRLRLLHPISARALEFEAPLPADFAALLAALEADLRGATRGRPAAEGRSSPRPRTQRPPAAARRK